MTKKIIKSCDIDDSFLMASIKGETKDTIAPVIKEEKSSEFDTSNQAIKVDEETTVPQRDISKEKKKVTAGKRKPKKVDSSDYFELFFQPLDITVRKGKAIYIRSEYHERIKKIIQVIGNNKITISGYIDNVLHHHFEQYHDEILERYNRENNTIF